MADALPPAPTPISELSTAASGSGRYQVPPLTVLALDALVAGFEVKPGMRGIPPKFAAALAARLPVGLDVRITAPHVDDESYWRRVCVEAHGWGRAEVAQHGNSWKQMCLERLVGGMLEEFGVDLDLPPSYEEEFCRPPIDGTHPRWPVLYPKQPPTRADGKPTRERFAANALSDPGLDESILSGGDSGWPHLEDLKQLVSSQLSAYAKSYAWASVDKSDLLAALAAETAAATGLVSPTSEAGGSAGPSTAPASSSGGRSGSAAGAKRPGGAKGKDGADAAPAVNLPPPPLPFAVEAERRRLAEAAAREKDEDTFDAQCNGAQLREFVLPPQLDTWKSTRNWPARRGESILTTRFRQLNRLLDCVAAAADYVYNLKIEQMPSHLDLQLVFSRLPNLTSLQLTYAMRHLGMRYDRALFGMRIRDARLLTECLRNTDTLTSLALPCNMIDDHLLVELMVGLLDNTTITHLDLSHNNITSAGVEVLVQLLKKGPCTLASLNLADNKLDAKAGRHLGRALRKNDSLVELNVRLNDLGDEGGRQLLEGLKSNSTLASLNMSSNRLGSATAALAAQVLASPETSIASLDLTGNKLDEADADILCRAMNSNSTMVSLDLRGNASIADTSESLQGIARLCHHNELRARGPLDPLAGLSIVSGGATSSSIL